MDVYNAMSVVNLFTKHWQNTKQSNCHKYQSQKRWGWWLHSEGHINLALTQKQTVFITCVFLLYIHLAYWWYYGVCTMNWVSSCVIYVRRAAHMEISMSSGKDPVQTNPNLKHIIYVKAYLYIHMLIPETPYLFHTLKLTWLGWWLWTSLADTLLF